MSQGLIQGSMREAPLPDIIQLVSQGGKSGCFHVIEDAKKAKIFLKDGRIAHALTNDAEGLDAIYEVALWLDGRYHFEEGAQDVPASITKSNASVLMEMHRRMDEWRVISQKITSLDLYPQSTLLPGETVQGVNPREARLLTILTGFYTVKELAEVIQKPVLNVAKDLYGLVMAGHVIMKGVRGGKRPELPPELAPPKAPAPTEAYAPPPVISEPIAPPPGTEFLAPPPAPRAEPPAPMEAYVPPPASVVPEFIAPPLVTEPLPPPAPPTPVAITPLSPAPAMLDPLKITKLNAFAQRIERAAKEAMPVEYHDIVDNQYSDALRRITAGEGPEAVKNLALSISRGAVDAGLDAECVKQLNASLKALFSK